MIETLPFCRGCVCWGVRGKIKSALNVRIRRKEKNHSCILHYNNCNDRNIHARIINRDTKFIY